jgi:hypothetical protein
MGTHLIGGIFVILILIAVSASRGGLRALRARSAARRRD